MGDDTDVLLARIQQEQQEAIERGRLLIDSAGELKQQRLSIERAEKPVTEELKTFLGMNPDIGDKVGERTLVKGDAYQAWLSDRAGTWRLDFATLASTPEGCEAIVELALIGALSVNGTTFTQHIEKVGRNEYTDLIERNLRRDPPSVVLNVERIK